MAEQRAVDGSAHQRITSVGVLGPIEAWNASGGPVRITRGQQRVLALLIESANRVVGAELLQETLWPHNDPKESAALLHTNIWTLRNLFGRDADEGVTPSLRRRESGYELRLDVLQYDWARCQRLRGAATRAVGRSRHREARAYLLDARRLWRGDALMGVSGEIFTAPFVRHLEGALAVVELQLMEVGLELGEHHALIPPLFHLTGKNQHDESLARLLMLALYRAGRQADALAAYSVCRKALAESGLVPTRQLSDTEVAILTHASVAQTPNPVTRRLAGSSTVGRMLVGNWPSFSPPTWALGDAELALLAEDEGGELIEVEGPSFVARFDEVDGALAAAVAVQNGLMARQSPPGRFVVHDGSWATTPGRGAQLIDLCERLLSQAAPGQVLVFGSAEAPDAHQPTRSTQLRELGQHHMGGGDPAIRLFQLVTPQLADTARPFTVQAAAPKHNLPPSPHRFVGREALIEDVARRLSHRRLVTLTGPGGVGKTRLAVETARTLAGEYRDGAWFVELEWLTDPELLVGSVAETVGIDRPRGRPVDDVVVTDLAERHLLLVLDACEHLLGTVRDFVDRLMAGCPRVSILATSLQLLGCQEEDGMSVPPLDVPDLRSKSTPSTDLRRNPAVQLFCDHLDPAPVGDHDLPAVALICRLVDGIPLAIAVAAARAPLLGLADLATELERTFSHGASLRLLDGSGKLRQAMEWSFSRLDEPDRRALTCLSLFAGPFTLEDAKALGIGSTGTGVAASLCNLANWSAIVVEGDGTSAPRYRLLQPVRAFASSQLDDSGQRARLSRRHAEIYLGVARAADHAFGRPSESDHLGRLDDCLSNVHAALMWAISAKEATLALDLAGSLWRYWFSRGHLEEGLRLLLAALALEHPPTPSAIRALGGSSYLAWWIGDLQHTSTSALETERLANAIGDDWGRAWAPLGLAAVSMFSPDPPLPAVDLRTCITYFVDADLPWEAGQALQLLAGRHWYQRDYRAAAECYARAVELSRAAGSHTFMDALQAHGLMLALQGQVDEGARRIQAGLELADRRRDPVGACHALTYLAAIAGIDGDYDEAARLYALALRAAADIGELWIVQWALDGLAGWAASSRPETAAQLLGHAEALAAATGIRLAPREQANRAATVNLVTKALGAAERERAFSKGRTMSISDAVELALGLGA